MANNAHPVILSAVRTPVGRFLGTLKSFTAPELGSIVVREAVKRAGLEPDAVDEVIMGNVLQAGVGQNPARQAALKAGLPVTVGALTINKVCGSGLKAVMLAAQAVRLGDAGVIVAGGMESMSRAPYLLRGAREGYRLGHADMVDVMIHDGLWEAYENYHMGCTAEVISEKYRISRKEQDAWAVRSHQRAIEATEAGHFRDEIVPVEVPQRKKPPLNFDTDETMRRDTSMEALARLKPAFKENGTVTAGNSPGVNDGAAAVVVATPEQAKRSGVEPLGEIVAHATSGIEPSLIMMAPLEAMKLCLARAGWSLKEVDLIEINEAFSAQLVALVRELKLDEERVNVQGGAVALGHPIGASGGRVLTTLLHLMKRRGARRGLATLCLGGGNAVAMAIERAR
ncbi:MAG: acetyl-CoA C-acetyltransferase [Acidobacteria bacterium]|nr:acetyl-CoA C-acetyltransferase [Acidobacteriota bacterium]